MKNVVFVCVHNSCRSQMAEGYMRAFADDSFSVHSAGLESYPKIKDKAVEAMGLEGIDISQQSVNTVDKLPSVTFDAVITMGCGAECPFIPATLREDWGIEDPSGGSIDDFKKARDIIKSRVLDLIERLNEGENG